VSLRRVWAFFVGDGVVKLGNSVTKRLFGA